MSEPSKAPSKAVWRKDNQPKAISPPVALGGDFLCVFNFGPDGRTLKLFERDDVRGQGVILPTLAVSVTPRQAEAVKGVLLRAIREAVALCREEAA